MSASYLSLVARFQRDLHFNPDSIQVDGFKRGLMKVHQGLMEHALTEVAGARTMLSRPASSGRAIVLAVYGRKVAEQGKLFPVFHTFESAFRSTLARWMHAHYRVARWWQDVYVAISQGKDATTVKQISGVALSGGAARAIAGMIKRIDGDDLSRSVMPSLSTGDEVLREAVLFDVGNLILSHWTHFQPRFSFVPSHPRLTRADFENTFKKVREARNDVYHHKSVSHRPDIVAAAEFLLDFIDVHLGAALDVSDPPGVKPFVPAITKEPRHLIGYHPEKTWRFAIEIFDTGDEVGNSDRLNHHVCIQVSAENAATGARRALNELTAAERDCAGSIRLLPPHLTPLTGVAAAA